MTSMFTNVLAGYEGSERSQDALALARVLVAPGGHITAACAYRADPFTARVGKGVPADAAARAAAEELLAPLKQGDEDDVSVVAAPGPSPAHALHDLVESGEHDLLVLGSTHRGTLGKVFAGTTAGALLQGSRRPVAVAPRDYRKDAAGLQRIGVAYNATDEARAALRIAHELAAERDAGLLVLQAYDSMPVIAAGGLGYGAIAFEPDVREAVEAELEKAVSELGGDVAVDSELLTGAPVPALIERSEELDLLVTGSRGYGPLGRVLVGSVSNRLMTAAACPVLVVPRDSVS
jgi:nucleotide-binding universal stress UspA family protein